MSRLSGTTPAVLLAALLCCFVVSFPQNSQASTEQKWHFKVYLDDKAIGYHHFSIRLTDGHAQLNTRAKFDVTFLKIPVFKYRHENVEQWNNRCLKSITSTTDQNGTLFNVNGKITDEGFQLSTREGETTLPACISTFSYWDKSFLRSERLLNSQTGEYLAVDVEELGKDTISVRNKDVNAEHYRLTADSLDIELWYSENGQWLALQSVTEKGRLLRYVIE